MAPRQAHAPGVAHDARMSATPGPPATPAGLRHPRQARVRAKRDFDAIFKTGRRVSTPAAALHWLARDEGARLGLAVSRKVDPDAVGRNRLKRAWRETFRHHRAQLAPADYVIVARPPARMLDGPALRALLLDLLRRARALPVPEAGLTMPPASSAAPARAVPPDAPSS